MMMNMILIEDNHCNVDNENDFEKHTQCTKYNLGSGQGGQLCHGVYTYCMCPLSMGVFVVLLRSQYWGPVHFYV